MMRRVRRRNPTEQIELPTQLFRWVVLGIFTLFWAVPIVWLVLAPTKTDNELLQRPPLSFGSLDTLAQTWDNLLWYGDGAILWWTYRSIAYAGTALVIAVATALLAGYALATAEFPGRRVILGLTLTTMILPVSATVLPLFLGMDAVGLLNTPPSVILPMAFFPFGVYLTYIYFRRSLPPSLLEAAAIDGANTWVTFTRIAVPLAKPIIGILAFLNFTVNWNRFFLPFVMLNDPDVQNLPVGLSAMVRSMGALRPNFAGPTPIRRPEVALAALILAIPVAIVFILSQRYVISGSLTGSTKE